MSIFDLFNNLPTLAFNVFFAWGWLIVVMAMLTVIWRLYLLIKRIDYVSSIQWTFLHITIPEDAEQTPKAMESIFSVLDGIHKGPDLVERYFDGYLEAWYSLELYCVQGKVRYVIAVPTMHKTFFEGVIYGQYPEAQINEIEDYTQKYSWEDIDKKIDLYGTEMVLVADDILPIRTYMEYVDTLAEEDKYVDPHQAMVESYTNIREGEEFWVQILVRPIDPDEIDTWAKKGEKEIDKLAGKEVKTEMNTINKIIQELIQWPGYLWKAAWEGPLEGGKKGGERRTEFPKISAGDSAKMDGILQKISKGGYRVKIRLIYLAPMGELTKPNISRLIGGFKQFSSFHLNSLKPDSTTKTNSPNYFAKQLRRYRRKRNIFLLYQWRDFFELEDGYMMSDEELATIYHFPAKYMRTPAIERAKTGVGGAPDNVPYV